MSEIKKKRIRYEILEDMEDFLNRKIAGFQEEISYHSGDDARDENGELPEWRRRDIQICEAKISECRDLIKALLKL